jgi:N-glycosylase/DNA lyase
MSRIVPMVRHLASYGPVMDSVDGQKVHRFPGPEVIAAIPEADLRAKGFGYRGATIPAVAVQVLERGEDWIDSLRSQPYEKVHTELCRLKGIGPKLADCIAIFALDHTEAIPIDTHVWQAYVRLYRPDLRDKALTDNRYREAAQFLRAKFTHHGAWAQQFLFYDNMLRWRRKRA